MRRRHADELSLFSPAALLPICFISLPLDDAELLPMSPPLISLSLTRCCRRRYFHAAFAGARRCRHCRHL